MIARVHAAIGGRWSGERTEARAATPQGVADDDKARQQRFLRADGARPCEPRLRQRALDGAVSGRDAAERGRAAQRLLLATAPQQQPDYDADSRTLVRAIVLDAAYQLK